MKIGLVLSEYRKHPLLDIGLCVAIGSLSLKLVWRKVLFTMLIEPYPGFIYTCPSRVKPSLFLKLHFLNVTFAFKRFKVAAIPTLFSEMLSSNITGILGVLLCVKFSTLFLSCLGHFRGSSFANSICTVARLFS